MRELYHGEDGSYVRFREGAGAYRCNQSPQKMAVRENRPITVFVINSPGVQKVAGGTTHSSSSKARNRSNNVPPSFTKDFEDGRVQNESSRRVTTKGSSSTSWGKRSSFLAHGAVSTSTTSGSNPTHLSEASSYEPRAVVFKLVKVIKTHHKFKKLKNKMQVACKECHTKILEKQGTVGK